MEFIEAPAFTRNISAYLADDEYLQLQRRLADNPETGDLMPGTGGFRKLRWADTKRGKGRRGGLRIIYYYFLADQQIWLMTLYDKSEASDLAPRQKKALKVALEAELASRKSKQSGAKFRRSRQ
jgi:hypothetical protein